MSKEKCQYPQNQVGTPTNKPVRVPVHPGLRHNPKFGNPGKLANDTSSPKTLEVIKR
jgi:hypothetical protein